MHRATEKIGPERLFDHRADVSIFVDLHAVTMILEVPIADLQSGGKLARLLLPPEIKDAESQRRNTS